MGKRRITYDRLQQGDVAVLAMQIAEAHGGSIDTTTLKALMHQKFRPRGIDAEINAAGQTNFSQVVGNLVSNQDMPESMFSKGYAEPTGSGFRLTPLGRQFLKDAPH